MGKNFVDKISYSYVEMFNTRTWFSGKLAQFTNYCGSVSVQGIVEAASTTRLNSNWETVTSTTFY